MTWDFLSMALPRLLAGLDETLLLAATALAIGFLLACLTALATLSELWPIRALARTYVYLFRSTPLLVQIFLIYYGSGQFRAELQSVGLWGYFREAWFCAILALSLNSGAYGAMIIRGGLMSVPLGEIEAARAIGMGRLLAFRRIVFPIAIRQALPAYSNEVILMIKATSLASTITIIEITGAAKKINSETLQPIPTFLIAGAIYLILNTIIARAFSVAETRLSHHRKTG